MHIGAVVFKLEPVQGKPGQFEVVRHPIPARRDTSHGEHHGRPGILLNKSLLEEKGEVELFNCTDFALTVDASVFDGDPIVIPPKECRTAKLRTQISSRNQQPQKNWHREKLFWTFRLQVDVDPALADKVKIGPFDDHDEWVVEC